MLAFARCRCGCSFTLCLSLLLLVGQSPPVHGQVLEPSHEVEGCEEVEKEFDSEVRVATLQWEELQVELMVVCFILLVVIAKTGDCTAHIRVRTCN